MKTHITTVIPLTFSLIFYAFVAISQESNSMTFNNNRFVYFLNAENENDNVRIGRHGGNALRIRYNLNSLFFDALDDKPVRITNSDGESKIQLHPNGRSYFGGGIVSIGGSKSYNGYDLTLNSGTLHLGTTGNAEIKLGGGVLKFNGDSNNTLFHIIDNGSIGNFSFNGNVGIGTIDPQNTLDVAGKIRAHEIKVEIFNAPDYVFAETYQLTTLEETNQYIQENHHLPEIPSAAEMDANGVNLGEMNMLLLKKIEELTLHLIEMKAKNQDMKSRIEKLERNENE